MSFPGDLEHSGIAIGQDHDPVVPLEVRSTRFARRALERDKWGEYLYEEDSLGDIEPNIVLWKRANKTARPYSAWAPCYAAVVVNGPDVGGDVASGPGGGCPDAPGNGGSVLPVGDDDFNPDSRFEPKNPAWPEDEGEVGAKTPQGSVGIVMAATFEDAQLDLFIPVDNRLVAVNFAGDPDMGSRVYDLTDDFRYDKTRWARLQTMMRVSKQPLGDANSLALQIGPTGCGEAFGGLVVQSNSQVGVVFAHMSKTKGGPFDVGDPRDIHTLGSDADGNPIHSLHFQTGALFRRDPVEDGPLHFEGIYPGAERGPHRMRVHLTWASGVWKWYAESPIYEVPTEWWPVKPQPVPSGGGTGTVERPGDLRPLGGPFQLEWDKANVDLGVVQPWMAQPFSQKDATGQPVGNPKPPDVATPPSLPKDFDKSTRDFLDELEQWRRENLIRGASGLPLAIAPVEVGPVVQSSAQTLGLGFVASLSNFATPGLLARPQNTTVGMDDLRSGGAISDSQIGKVDAETPVTGMMAAFGAQGGGVPSGGYGGNTNVGYEGDPWHFTHRPNDSKYRGGTASGGWFIFPPEVGPEDRTSGFAPPGVTLSSTYFGVAPGARFAAGTPETANGGVATGYSWGVESATGDLLFYSHPNTTVGTAAVRFGNTTQDISWYSGTTFAGTLGHANTANRTYSFPNLTATVELFQTGAGSPVGVVSGKIGTLYWDTTALTFYVNNDDATAWTVLVSGPTVSLDQNILANQIYGG